MLLEALRDLGVLDEVSGMLKRVGLLQMAFNFLPAYPCIFSKFLASFCLRTHHLDEHNPFFTMRFKLGGRERFLTTQDFDNIFGFKRGGKTSIPSTWLPNSFWMTHILYNSL